MRSTKRSGFTLVELLTTLSIVGVIATASGALLISSFDAFSGGSSHAALLREGQLAMERMTSGLRRSTLLLAPKSLPSTANQLSFSGLVNQDDDYYFNDPLFPRYDEDFGADSSGDGANGLVDVDDDWDSSTDEKSGFVILAYDHFDSVGFDGGGNWTLADAPWIEQLEADGAAAGVVQVARGPGGEDFCLRIGGDGVSIDGALVERQADFALEVGAELSYRVAQSGLAGGSVAVQIKKPSEAWVTLTTHVLGGESDWQVRAFDVFECIGMGTKIRFLGSGVTGTGGYLYIDDVQVRHKYFAIGGDTTGDDDEDGDVDEDWIDGVDNDMDGLVDEDPPADSNEDAYPGHAGIDDDGDGTVDEGDPDDDDEDGLIDEDPIQPVRYYLKGEDFTLIEVDPVTKAEVVIARRVTAFSTELEAPNRVRIDLELTGVDGYVLLLSEVVCLRNVDQRSGKRVR